METAILFKINSRWGEINIDYLSNLISLSDIKLQSQAKIQNAEPVGAPESNTKLLEIHEEKNITNISEPTTLNNKLPSIEDTNTYFKSARAHPSYQAKRSFSKNQKLSRSKLEKNSKKNSPKKPDPSKMNKIQKNSVNKIEDIKKIIEPKNVNGPSPGEFDDGRIVEQNENQNEANQIFLSEIINWVENSKNKDEIIAGNSNLNFITQNRNNIPLSLRKEEPFNESPMLSLFEDKVKFVKNKDEIYAGNSNLNFITQNRNNIPLSLRKEGPFNESPMLSLFEDKVKNVENKDEKIKFFDGMEDKTEKSKVSIGSINLVVEQPPSATKIKKSEVRKSEVVKSDSSYLSRNYLRN